MKSKKPKSRRIVVEPDDEKERLNLLVDADLKRWAQDYAKRNCTTLTSIISGHLVDLREREKSVDVEQI